MKGIDLNSKNHAKETPRAIATRLRHHGCLAALGPVLTEADKWAAQSKKNVSNFQQELLRKRKAREEQEWEDYMNG